MKRNELARLESEAALTPKMSRPEREREREGGGLDLVWIGRLIGWQTSKGSADQRLIFVSRHFNPFKSYLLFV